MAPRKEGKIAPEPSVTKREVEFEEIQVEEGEGVGKQSKGANLNLPRTDSNRRKSMAVMIEEFDEKKKPYLKIQYTRLKNLGSFDDVVMALDKETLNATDEFEMPKDDDNETLLYMDDHLQSMFSYLDIAGDGFDGVIGSKQLKMLQRVFPSESGFSHKMFSKQEGLDFVSFRQTMMDWAETREAKMWAKNKYQIENIEEIPEVAMWSGLGEEFEINNSLLLLFLFLHTGTATVYAFYWQTSAKYTFSLGLICIIYAAVSPRNYLRKLMASRKRLQQLSPMFIPALFSSFALLLVNLLIGSIAFGVDPLYENTAEQVFPWMVCILVTLGFSFITLYSNAETSRLARKRDAYLLACVPVATSPKHLPGEMLSSQLTRASEVLVILYRNVGREQIAYDHKYYNFRKSPRKIIARVAFFGFGSLLAIVYNMFCYYNPDVLSSTSTWETIYQPGWQEKTGGNNDNHGYIWYSIMTLFGSASTLCSTLCFEYAISVYTTRPFRESLRLLEYLQATTDTAEARHFVVPYLPLYERVNVKAFLNLWTYLFKHQHKGTLNQGAAGLAGVMVIDLLVITILAVQYFFPAIAPSPLIMGIEFFYALVLSYSGVYQLFFATRINKVHEDLGHRISEWQGKALYNHPDHADIDRDELYHILKQTNQIMKGAFETVKILGIPATFGLAQAFGGYIMSAAIFILISIVNQYGKV